MASWRNSLFADVEFRRARSGMTDLLLLIYCVCIVMASLAGGYLPSVLRLTHLRMQVTMSLVAGMMLGVALLHMIPHAAEQASVRTVSGSALLGILVMFFLLRVFHVHHYHDVPDDEGRACPAGLAHEPLEHETHDHDDCGHDHSHDHDHAAPADKPNGGPSGKLRHSHSHSHDHAHGEHDHQGAHQLTWTGLLVGLAIHTLLDGIALGAAVAAAGTNWLAGFGTFLAIALHKPLDALSITALMRAGGWPMPTRTMVNISFAMMCPLGAVLHRFGETQLGDQGQMVGCTLGFSAGFFICIALGDLLPEVAFHSHDRLKLSIAMVVGVLLAVLVELVHLQTHRSHAAPAPVAMVSPVACAGDDAATTQFIDRQAFVLGLENSRGRGEPRAWGGGHPNVSFQRISKTSRSAIGLIKPAEHQSRV
ncbi:MAG: ZIP family metal transporter [Planctomycetales bacterium]|nr:ZIP family metal transporter [Planctomycetales bacterium]